MPKSQLSSDTVESEGRQMKQSWIKYWKNPLKNPLLILKVYYLSWAMLLLCCIVLTGCELGQELTKHVIKSQKSIAWATVPLSVFLVYSLTGCAACFARIPSPHRATSSSGYSTTSSPASRRPRWTTRTPGRRGRRRRRLPNSTKRYFYFFLLAY